MKNRRKNRRMIRGTLLFGLPLALIAFAQGAEPQAPYRTKCFVVNVHRHGAQPTEEALRAELSAMDRTGIDKVVILDGDSPPGTLPAWLELQKKYPDRLAVFLKADFRDSAKPDFFASLVRKLESAQQAGVKGVKVWKDLGMANRDQHGKLITIDDPRLDPFWAKCGELKLPVLIHSADPREYWYPLTYNSLHYGLRQEADQYYRDPEMPSYTELMRQRDHVLEKHPATTFIGAHMGSLEFDLAQLGATLDKYPNFNVDCAARLRMLGRVNPPAIRDFFTKYQDRLLFGTDGAILSAGRKPDAKPSRNITIYPADNPDMRWHDANDKAAVEKWEAATARSYAEYLQYFETERVDLVDPSQSGGAWLRLFGAGLPPEVLEKFYHGNAERLIPDL